MSQTKSEYLSNLLGGPCTFCGYNGEGYWQSHTHTRDCPMFHIGGIDAREDALHHILREYAGVAKLWASACELARTHIEPLGFVGLGQSFFKDGIPTLVELYRRRGVEIEDLSRALSAMRLDLEQAREQRDEARKNYQFMVDKACAEKLDGYRELGAKCAALEAERDELAQQIRRIRAGEDTEADHLLPSEVQAQMDIDRLRADLRGMQEDYDEVVQERDKAEAELKNVRAVLNTRQERQEKERRWFHCGNGFFVDLHEVIGLCKYGEQWAALTHGSSVNLLDISYVEALGKALGIEEKVASLMWGEL
jgi:hypothetical protein